METRSGPIEVLSVDVFDTFLLRRCAGPEGVFERAFALGPIAVTHPSQAEDFVRARQAAEAAAREAALARFGAAEVSIDDVYAHFPLAHFGLGDGDWARLVAAEFQAEHEMCLANPELAETLPLLRRNGLRVGFVADGCWDGKRLAELLRICAPDLEWDFLFTACDLRAGKADTLFTQVLGHLRVPPRAAAHMGDNDLADVASPRALGMHAIPYPQAGAALAALFRREAALAEEMWGPVSPSHRLDGGTRTLRRAIAARAPRGSAAFDYGMQVLGPVMAAFDRFVATRVHTLAGHGAPVAVVFAGEHGRLPLEIWRVARDVPAVHLPGGDLAELFSLLPTLDLCRHTIAVVEADGEGCALPSLRAACRDLPHQVHGLHLLGEGGPDADALLTPHLLPPTTCAALHNHMATLNMLCGASGSGRPFREMCDMVRMGAAYFAREATTMGGLAEALLAPEALPWIGATLARALLRPSDDDRALLAALRRHDGGETPCGTAEVALISPGGQRHITISRLRDGLGDIRLRVPVSRDHAGSSIAVAVPAAALPARGTVRAITLQSGDTAVEAMRNPRIRTLPLAAVQPEDMTMTRGTYESGRGHGRLLIALPPLECTMELVTLTVSPVAEAC